MVKHLTLDSLTNIDDQSMTVRVGPTVRASHVCCAPEVSLGFPASPAAPGTGKKEVLRK